MKKRIVLSGYFGFRNFGDEAILSVLVNKLQQNRNRLTIITSDPEYTKSLYSHIRVIKTFDFHNIIAAIYKSDILISGGGSLLQDVTSLKSLIYYLMIIFIGIFLRKKVIIFAQGIGPIKSQFGQFLTKSILKKCSYVSVRDKKSHELLKEWGIKSELLCDPIFSVNISPKEKTKTVAVQLRDCKGMNMDFLDRLADAVCRNFRDYNIDIYSFQDSIDLEICKTFENKIKILNPEIKTKLYNDLTNMQIIENLNNAQYLISMRFHAIIIGLLSGIKTLGINYDIKVEKLAKEFGLPLIDIKNDFGNAFEHIKSQNLKEINEKVTNKNFDWSGFDKIIKGND
ncbi:polysaccharide pyruvyl transferase CsaB [bacterium]|nr:polysaccharide pyruvyl transferase CsaB [bacterium]